VRSGRRLAATATRSLRKPEVAAWKRACREAERVARYTRGSIRLLEYDIEYVDLLSLCPQWNDLFVRNSLKVRLDEPSPRILDCGANIGLASLYFKRQYPRARITAFEADPDIHSVLERNLRVNGCGDVEVVHAAVWTGGGTIGFRCEGGDSGAVEEHSGDQAGPGTRVPAVRLRDVLAKGEVSVLKLDIEGSEELVLRDCAGVLGSVKVLLLDIHEFDPLRRATPMVFEILAKAGFTFTLDDLCPLPWRAPTGSPQGPFPGTHLCWAALIRAWRV
jgi:FkbM family methyltransferase